MAESVRELVVTLSLEAGSFSKTCTAINAQIKGVQAEFNALTGGTDAWQTTMDGRNAKLASLNETLALQQQKITEIREELEKATKALEGDQTLAGAKKVSNLETQLNNAKTAAALTKAEIEKINAISLQQFGAKLEGMGRTLRGFGRKFSMYIGGPLAALGIKAFNTAADYETAFVSMQKTVEETGTTTHEMISDAFLAYSEEAPVAYTELMELAGAAGALGVGADQVVEFVKSVAMISATADDLDAQSGADALARLLNITEGGDFSNILATASSVTALGNATASTEGEILEMATRMASTGELAGFTTAQILAMAAGFTSVGINAEAGGSAASKLMKKMQIASEVGLSSLNEFNQFYDTEFTARELQLLADDKSWVTGRAEEMGKTKEEIKGMVEAVVSLQQFADVAGTSMEGFAAGWDENAGTAMMEFFKGLSAIESGEGTDTVLTKLNEMGLTEIRLSNLIAAATTNPELFTKALELSDKAFTEKTALLDEATKRYETASSYLDIQMNQIENTEADAGENVIDVFQPVIDKISDLVAKFGELPEDVQTRWVLISAALVALGPVASFIGTLTSGVGKLVGHFAKVKLEHANNLTAAANGLTKIGGISAFGIFAVAAGVGALALELTRAFAPGMDDIINKLKNIKISVDEGSVQTALDAIARVQEAADKLSGEEFKAEYGGYSAAVKAGFGTMEMFGQAVGYEKVVAQRQIAATAAEYGPIFQKYNDLVLTAVKNGDQEMADRYAQTRDKTMAEWKAVDAETRASYTKSMSDLISGMLANNPQLKATLEKAAKEYDIFKALQGAMAENTSAGWQEFFTPEILKQFFPEVKDLEAIDPEQYATYGEKLSNMLTKSMTEALASAGEFGEGSPAYTLLNTLFADPGNFELLDVTGVQGALDGMIELLDFQAAGGAGANLTKGLADGAVSEAYLSMPGAMTAVKEAVLTFLRAAFKMESPSKVMAAEGIYLSSGLAVGVMDGMALAVAAVTAVGEAMLEEARKYKKKVADELGANDGIEEGVDDTEGVEDGMGDVADRMVASLERGLDMHSPSMVMKKEGSLVVDGIVQGVTDYIPDAVAVMVALGDAMKDEAVRQAKRISSEFSRNLRLSGSFAVSSSATGGGLDGDDMLDAVEEAQHVHNAGYGSY